MNPAGNPGGGTPALASLSLSASAWCTWPPLGAAPADRTWLSGNRLNSYLTAATTR